MTNPKNLTGRVKCTFKRKHPLTSKLLLVVQVEEYADPIINNAVAASFSKRYWRDATIDDFSVILQSDFSGLEILSKIGKKK